MTNRCFWVETVKAFPATVGADTYIQLIRDDDHLLEINVWQSSIAACLRDGLDQASSDTFDYSLAAHRWWRIRAAAGTTYLETSPDAATWGELWSLPTPAFFSSVRLKLAAGLWSSEPAPERAKFDNVNVLP